MNATTRTVPVEPCPFCGSTKLAESFVSNTGCNVRYVWCVNCNAKGPWAHRNVSPTEQPADKWDQRVAPAAQPVAEQVNAADTERLDSLAKLYKACPHAIMTWNDDPETPGPVGYSISIDGCDPITYIGETLRELLDLIKREFKPVPFVSIPAQAEICAPRCPLCGFNTDRCCERVDCYMTGKTTDADLRVQADAVAAPASPALREFLESQQELPADEMALAYRLSEQVTSPAPAEGTPRTDAQIVQAFIESFGPEDDLIISVNSWSPIWQAMLGLVSSHVVLTKRAEFAERSLAAERAKVAELERTIVSMNNELMGQRGDYDELVKRHCSIEREGALLIKERDAAESRLQASEQALKIAEEELQQYKADNSQFGAGA